MAKGESTTFPIDLPINPGRTVPVAKMTADNRHLIVGGMSGEAAAYAMPSVEPVFKEPIAVAPDWPRAKGEVVNIRTSGNSAFALVLSNAKSATIIDLEKKKQALAIEVPDNIRDGWISKDGRMVLITGGSNLVVYEIP